ncbi:DeoR/GlpR transcriptional regulator [Brachybacterium sp. EF45031]|uniref:DeoR/GlpR family DNA-binding transcription regulator n=1 Tax=Brachybacterium sillae TaxID=2810536 RepID=UPI00217E5ABB|nr:DeoR/GlpR family DNA-binding transcription regulator [Brachybacterium sillae]MCS6710745.1 DeoR/GlpR transcriptional regulator [Brachybacterium sillae]
MFQDERRRVILDELTQTRRVSVTDLAARFAVAGETIRRDLDALAADGALTRVHGGALAVDSGPVETDLPTRRTEHVSAKQAIARAAHDLLPAPGGSVLVDAGTTTAALVPALAERGLVLFTHSPEIAQDLAAAGAQEVHVLPGRLRPTTRAAVGSATLAALGSLRVDLALVGGNGVDGEGFSTPDPEEAAVKRALLARAALGAVLVDASKMHRRSLVTFAGWTAVDVLVTDNPLPGDLAEVADRSGLEVLLP